MNLPIDKNKNIDIKRGYKHIIGHVIQGGRYSRIGPLSGKGAPKPLRVTQYLICLLGQGYYQGFGNIGSIGGQVIMVCTITVRGGQVYSCLVDEEVYPIKLKSD